AAGGVSAMMASTAMVEAATAPEPPSEMLNAFEPFVKRNEIKIRWDDRFFYVESDGIPDHAMMVGITSWQQQVPLPQSYFGGNAWRIPLVPKVAKSPLSTKNRFLRGAIAIAANGIPIFNPLNNRGDDAYLVGELDEFGGHCGRADDYHYHLPPIHLQPIVGVGAPIAYALDGYPIYGLTEADGSPVKNLDAFNGHVDTHGEYHYHSTKKYPYLNGGFHGEVVEKEGQVDPQPRAEPVRPSLPPMRGATITKFEELEKGRYKLIYDVNGRSGSVTYRWMDSGAMEFVFVEPNGTTKTETYSRNNNKGRRNDGPGRDGQRQPPPRGQPPQDPPPRDPPPNDDPPPRKSPPDGRGAPGNPPPPRNNPPDRNSPPDRNGEVSLKPLKVGKSGFAIQCAALDAKGTLPVEYTCDGAKASPPLEWRHVPEGTKSIALSIWHTAPDQEKSYWIVYNIPVDKKGLEKNSKGVGVVGLNDKKRAEYDPMCSKGPGKKQYHVSVFALSEMLPANSKNMDRAGLLKAIREIQLDEAELSFIVDRGGK
ncbi:MAG: YHYH protein, partial [Planctomycetes bacterium]|nr:YHYH protein [Planctomycetota bacterium]